MTVALALAIDVGSSAVRCAVVDADGMVVASSRVARIDAAAGATFDVERLWRDVVRTIRDLPIVSLSAVAAVGIAGHVGTVFVDADLQPVVDGRGWGDVGGVDQLATAAGGALPRLLRVTGRAVVTGGAGAAFLDLRTHQPRAAARVTGILTPKDLIIARMTGRSATDRTSAAYTGLSAVESGTWSPQMLRLVGASNDQLPPQIRADEVVASVTASVGRELGIRADAVVVAGATDGSVGAAYVLGDREDIIADIAGTTDVLLRRTARLDAVPVGAVVNPYPLGGFGVGGPTGTTGGALARWAELLGFGDVAEAVRVIELASDRIGPGAAGLSMDPSLSGRRFPRWQPDATGAVFGQRDHHGPEHLLLAAVEGAAYVVREGVDRLDPTGTAPVVLAGGVARSRVLAQLRADVLGRPVELCPEPDVTVLGAAALAFRGIGVDMPVAQTGGGGRAVPDPAAAAAYERLFGEWQKRTQVA